MGSFNTIEKQKALREGLMRLYCKACYDEDADPFYDTWEVCYEKGVCAFCTESVVDPFLAFLSEQGRNIGAERLVDIYGLDPFQALEFAGVMCDAIFATAPLQETKEKDNG